MSPSMPPMPAMPPMPSMPGMCSLPSHLQPSRPQLYPECYSYPHYDSYIPPPSKSRPSPYGHPMDYGTYPSRVKSFYYSD